MHKLRTVIEEDLVKARIQKAAKDYPQLKRFWDNGLIWLLARKPESLGRKISDIGIERYVYTFPSWAPGGLPRVSITYQITENEVIIEASRIDLPRPPKKGS